MVDLNKLKLKTEKRTLIKGFIIFALLFFAVDLAYKMVNNISYLTRQKCILYKILPKFGFLLFEYFVELFLIVLVGIFLAVLLETWFSKYKRFYPKNMITAFLYASLLPVCACTIIPLISAMRNKLSFRAIITFVVAAPLLSPYIVLLSFSVLGIKYGVLRIISAFVLAVLSGYIVEFFYTGKEKDGFLMFSTVSDRACGFQKPDIYLKTYDILKKVLPYLIIAGIIGILIEYAAPADLLSKHQIANNFFDVLVVIFVGIPVYFCNGAEVLLLRPLIHQSGLYLGSAMAFSLASTSICTTSFVMLMKFLGKRLTLILTVTLIIITFLIGILINATIPDISF
jgi:uncharacterized membrane protein YraQ (UPF0718 family)